MLKQNLNKFSKSTWALFAFIAFEVILFLGLTIYSFTFMTINENFGGSTIVYMVVVFVSLALLCGFCCYKSKRNIKNVVFIVISIFVTILFTVLLANFESPDYLGFLEIWCDSYSKLSFGDALKNIVNISNYTPLYNYFLIVVAKLGFDYLYSIKFLSLIFSVVLAYVIEKLISFVRKEDFNYLRFCLFINLPACLLEFAAWGQCDMIYTCFALFSLYFALKKKSKLSFLFIGLSFSLKLQFLFMVPVLFVMLIVKDENNQPYLKWKDLWIAPLIYVVNLIPVVAGASLLDLILVYFKQTGTDYGIGGNGANIGNVLRLIGVNKDNPDTILSKLSPVFMAVLILITALIMIYLIIKSVKKNKKECLKPIDFVYLAMVFSFFMMFFMPKMLERFYFIAMAMAVVYAFCKKDKMATLFALLINNALYFMMYMTCYFHSIPTIVTTFTSVVGIVSGFVVAILIFIDLKKWSKISKE